MSNKTVIGGTSGAAKRAIDEQQRADTAAAEVTMIKRRVRTFYNSLTEVSFPADAPSWAPDWVEWILTGEVATVGETTEETANANAASQAGPTPSS